jgi:hypothetical protein
MNSAQEAYKKLLALSKQYLLQEYALTDRIPSEGDTYQYFTAFVQQQRRLKQEESQRPSMAQRKEQNGHLPPPQGKDKEQFPQGSVTPPSFLPPDASRPAPPVIADPAHSTRPPSPAPTTTLSNPPLEPLSVPAHTVSSAKRYAPPVEHPKPSEPAASAAASTPSAASASPASKARLQLETPAAMPPPAFEGLRKIIQEKLPRISLVDHVPDDTEARRQARLWEQPPQTPQVWILSANDTPKQSAFLANIEKTLALYGIHAQISNPFNGNKRINGMRFYALQNCNCY